MYQILSIIRLIVLLGFFSLRAASGPTIQATLPLSEESASPQIIKGYALKRMLQTVMALYPDLPAKRALLFSPLIAEMNRDWALNAYGTFELVPLKKEQADGTFELVPGRLEQKFATTTPLNQITRMLFNVTDSVMIPTAQPSNPFFGLDAKTVAHMMHTLHSDGIQGLITMLQTQCKAEQKPAKGKQTAPTDNTVKQWYETYRSIKNKSGKNDFKQFKRAIKEKFIPLLISLDTEAITPEDKEKNVENLSKLLMTYTFFKDKTEGTSNPAYSIPEYLKALGSTDFKVDYGTRIELEELDKIFKGTARSSHLKPDAHGVEQVAFYLEDKIYGGVQALQAPYTTFISTPITDPHNRFNGGEFPYCVEATVRSIINLILYDPVTGKIDVHLLSTLAQESMDPEIKAFLEKHNDPLAPRYYQETETEFLCLMSGIEKVLYKQDAPQGGFEISGLLGSKNILAVLNHVFGRKAITLEALATTLSKNIPGHTITFTPTVSGYDLRVSDNTGLIAQGSLIDKEGAAHAAFLVESSGFFDLLTSKEFIPLITKMNQFLGEGEDLFRICFTDKTLHPSWSIDQPMPLNFVIKEGLTEVLKIMLRYETKPINYEKLLMQAINYSDSLELTTFLLSLIAKPGYKRLLTEATISGHGKLVNLFLPHVESPDYNLLLNYAICSPKDDLSLIKQLLAHVSDPDYTSLLTEAAKSGSLQKINFFFEKGANINGSSTTTPLKYAIEKYFYATPSNIEKLLEAIAFLIQKGATVSQENIDQAIQTKNIDLVTLLLPHLTDPDYNHLLLAAIRLGAPKLIELFIDKGADANTIDPTNSTPLSLAINLEEISIVETLVKRGAIVTTENLEQAKPNAELFEFLKHEYITQKYGI